MSLGIEKFEEGGNPEVRLYKRGNDQVNLDDFVRQAEVGFNGWLNNVNIKDKYKKEVRDAYRDLITRINENPESFAAKLGGGFTNTAGITNATEGFDAYGIAAGYLGNTLRSMQVYNKPEEKTDKQKYKRDSRIINSTIQSSMWGDDPTNFVMLDQPDPVTGKRGTARRDAQTISGLTNLRDNIDRYYIFDSEDDKKHAIDRINLVLEKLQNSDPNDDWFYLGQLGATGLDRFFYNGSSTPSAPRSQEEEAAAASVRRSQQFESWVATHYPRYTGTLHNQVHLTSSSDLPVSNSTLVEFANKFNSFTKDDLVAWIREYITNIDNYDINNNQFMRRIFPYGIPNFNTGQVISTILQKMKDSNMLQQVAQGSTLYYIPGTRMSNGTAYVWDSSSSVNSLYHVSIHDIPYWQQKILEEFQREYPSSAGNTGDTYFSSRYPSMYEYGGVVMAKKGVKTRKKKSSSSQSDNWKGIGHTDQFNWYEHGLSTWIDDLIQSAIDAEDKEKFAELVNNTQHAHSLLASRWTGPAYAGTNNDVGNYQQGINDNFKYVNDKGVSSIRKNSYYVDPENPKAIDRGDNGWAPDNHYSAQTDDRRVLGRRKKLDDGTIIDDLEGKFDELAKRFADAGYELYFDESDNYYKLKVPKADDTLSLDGETEENPEENPEATANPEELYDLEEVLAQLRSLSTKNNLMKNGLWEELGLDLLDAGRLAGSIWANNRISKIVDKSLRPRLHNTYELYSPVTGAFSEMQLRNRQGAETLSQAQQPFTTDASLASARMLEGKRLADELQYQGFAADDKEIKRTQAEALKRQEDNVARRTALANENLDSIIANNQARAQLEASRVKQNWNSIDNYLQGVLGRRRQSLTEERDRRNQFALQVGQSEADLWRETQISALRDKYRAWAKGDTSKTFSDWVTQNQESYTQAMKRINAKTAALKYRSYADIYGLKYDWPTMTENGIEVPLDFDITKLPWNTKWEES